MISLAIDIGGSKCVTGLVTREGRVLSKRCFRWEYLSGDAVVDTIVRESRMLLAANPDAVPAVIGASIPGLADPAEGLWVEASFSGIRNLPIAAILSETFDLPAYIDNDGQACALAETLYGAGRGVADFLYMTISNGIGGAIVSGGRLLTGSGDMAGEFGHCTVVENGRPCKCGLRGCLEVHAAGPAIARNYLEYGGLPLPDGALTDAAEIAKRAQAGEEAAQAVFRLEGVYLGKVIATACNLLNPEKVILGGGVSQAFSLFESTMLQTVGEHMYQNANRNLQILSTPLGYDGGLLGAAAVGMIRAGGERKGGFHDPKLSAGI